MGQKDGKLREFLCDERLYADLWNGSVFGGRAFVHAEELEEMNPILLMSGKGRKIEKIRDLVMKENRKGIKFVVWTLENQEEIDYRMPARIMLSEALEYDRQIRKISDRNKELKKAGKSIKELYENNGEFLYDFRKEDKLYPVVTLVLYWGKKEWDGPKTLYEMIDFGVADSQEEAEFVEELKKLMPDFSLHFLDMSNIENTERFKTELGPFFELYKRRNDKEAFVQYLSENEAVERMDEKSWQMLVDMTESKRLKKLIDTKNENNQNGRKEEKRMCKALEDYYNDAKSEGKNEGIKEGIKVTIRTCKKLGNDMDKVKSELMREYGLGEETAEEYMKLYW